MNVLTGLHKKDAGTIFVDGEERTFEGPKEAERAGISFIHQEMITWPEMTVSENIFVGKENANKFGFLNKKSMDSEAKKALDELVQ